MLVNPRFWHHIRKLGIGKKYNMFKNFRHLFWFANVNLLADYRNKRLGILWHPLSSILFIFTVGFVFSNIQNTDTFNHLAYVASGYTAWIFVASVITSGSKLYKIDKSKILTGAHTPRECILLALARNVIQFFINHISLIIIFIVIIVFTKETEICGNLIFLPVTLFIFFIVAYNSIIIASLICLKYPDCEELVSSSLRISFLTTPIMWERPYKNSLEFYDINPFYHFIEIYRFCFSSSSFPIKSFFITLIFTAVLGLIGFVTNRSYLNSVSRSLI